MLYGYSIYGSMQSAYSDEEIVGTVKAVCNVKVPYATDNETIVLFACNRGYSADLGLWLNGFSNETVYLCTDVNGDGQIEYPLECTTLGKILVDVPEMGTKVYAYPLHVGDNPCYVVITGDRTDVSTIYVLVLIRKSVGPQGYIYSNIPVPKT